MRRLRVFLAAASATVVFASSGAAFANGRFPAAGQLVVSPKDPSHLVLRATYGILFSNDGGQNWDWMCEKAVGYGGQVEDPSIAITSNDTLVISTFEGLAISPDHGCAWGFAGGDLDKRLFTDVAIHKDQPSHVDALVSQYANMFADGGFQYTNLIYSSTDDGTTWTPKAGVIDSTMIAETLDSAPSDPERLYVSGIRGSGSGATGIFLTSKNGGQSFTESTIPLISLDEHAPYISAVDPTNADRVYVRISGATSGRLLVSDDAGVTFRTIFSGPPLFGFALSPDGSKVFVGSQNGLSEASSSDLTFTSKSSVSIQCLATSGSTLYACSTDTAGFILGASQDDGATFTPLLHLNTLRGPLACPPESKGAICVPDWPSLAASLGENIDAGTDAGATAQPPPSSSSGCSCNLPNGRDAGVGAIAAFVASVLAIAIRRKKAA